MWESLFQNLLHSIVWETTLFKEHTWGRNIASFHSDLVLAAVCFYLGLTARLNVRVWYIEVFLERSESDCVPADFPEVAARLVILKIPSSEIVPTAATASEASAAIASSAATTVASSPATTEAAAASLLGPITRSPSSRTTSTTTAHSTATTTAAASSSTPIVVHLYF